MRSPFRRGVAAAAFVAGLAAAASSTAASGTRELKICADPNNLPFSNDRLEGFENRIAELLAKDLHASVRYTWWAQRRGFLRNTLKAGLCDVVLGLPSAVEMAATTRPYYRSTYVFVTLADRRLDLKSLDDPRLKTLRVGVQIVGDDYASSPPAHALSNRGIVNNVVGYTVYGDYTRANPPARIVEAVAKGEVDTALVWGPLAGYFAKRQGVRLAITPVSPQIDLPFLPFVFDISVGVRRGEDSFKEEIEAVLARRHREIEKILDAYGVPRVGSERRAGL